MGSELMGFLKRLKKSLWKLTLEVIFPREIIDNPSDLN